MSPKKRNRLVILQGGFEGIGDKCLDGLFAEAEKRWELEVDKYESPTARIDPILAQSVLVWKGSGILRIFVRHPSYSACTSTVEVPVQEWQMKVREDLETGETVITEVEFILPKHGEPLRVVIDGARTPPKASHEIADYTSVLPEERVRVRRQHGPIERTKRRADLFKSLKDENLALTQVAIARRATEILQKAGELAPDEWITAEQVAKTYKAMGWKWNRGKRIR
jgi:hypothetical protein